MRFTVDNRNRLIFYGNPVGYVKDDAAVVDEMFRTDELNQYLSRMNLTPRWEDGIFDRLISGEVTGEEPVLPRKGCRIWQLKKDVDVAMRFIGYEDQVRKFGEPDAGNYTLVFDGDLGTSDLEQIYTICRDAPPPGYQGYAVKIRSSDSREYFFSHARTFLVRMNCFTSGIFQQPTSWPTIFPQDQSVSFRRKVLKFLGHVPTGKALITISGSSVFAWIPLIKFH